MLAGRLTARAAAESGNVVWLAGPEGDPDLLARLDPRTVDVMVGSVDLAGARMLDLVAVMDRLRSPGGCPWDAAQTHASLLPYLLEETYETVEAVETGDRAELCARSSATSCSRSCSTPGCRRAPSGPVGRRRRRGGHRRQARPTPSPRVRRRLGGHRRRRRGRLGDPEADREGSDLGRRRRPARPAGPRPGRQADVPRRQGRPDRPRPRRLAAPSTPDAEVGDLLLAVVALARAAGIDAEAALRSAARRYAPAIKTAESALPTLTPDVIIRECATLGACAHDHGRGGSQRAELSVLPGDHLRMIT